MPLSNPYPIASRSGPNKTTIQCTFPLQDRFLLASFSPGFGTFEAILATLLKNLIDELRLLNPTGELVLDGTRILEILCERRQLQREQAERLTRTSAGDRLDQLGGYPFVDPLGGQNGPPYEPRDSSPLRPGTSQPPNEPGSNEGTKSEGRVRPSRKAKGDSKRSKPSEGGAGK